MITGMGTVTMKSNTQALQINYRPPAELTKTYNKKRNLYLLGLMIAILLILFLVSYARHLDEPLHTTEVNEAAVAERESIAGKSPVVLVSNPEPYIAGIDIEPGRYMVTTERGFGGFVVYETGTSLPEISELIGYFADPHHVPSVAVTLADTQEIMVYGAKLRDVVFTPLETVLLTELTTGVWVVGLDILPGTYTVSSKDGRTGNLTVLEGDLPVARVSLGSGGGTFKEYETITIKEGEVIRISNIPTVSFVKEEFI